MSILEGVEVEKQIGDLGAVKLDVTPELKIIAEVSLKKEIDLMVELEKYVEASAAKWDDAALDLIKKALVLLKK